MTTNMTHPAPAGSSATRPAGDGHRQKVLFIGGMGRSGSTLVERLLNELSQTFAVGETVHLWERGVRNHERCGCGQDFNQCQHWTAVGHQAFGGWAGVDLDEVIGLRWSVDRTRQLPAIARSHRRGRPGPDQARYLDHLRAVLLAAGHVADSTSVANISVANTSVANTSVDSTVGGSTVLLESSKHLSTAALLSLDPALEVRVLHLIRDPRGVAYSWTKQVERPEAANELMPVYSPARTAGRWLSDNLGFEALARRVPTVRMRYEDFLTDPVHWLQRIGALVDLDASQLDLSFLDGDTATLSTVMHSVAGNPLRFGRSETTLRLDDAWRSELPRLDRNLVTSITAPLLEAYGYPVRV